MVAELLTTLLVNILERRTTEPVSPMTNKIGEGFERDLGLLLHYRHNIADGLFQFRPQTFNPNVLQVMQINNLQSISFMILYIYIIYNLFIYLFFGCFCFFS